VSTVNVIGSDAGDRSTMWRMSDETEQPVLRVIRAATEQILDGRLVAHQQLPSIRELSAAHDVSTATVQKSLKEMKARGLLYSQHGRGVFVSADAQQILSITDAAKIQTLTERVDQLEQHLAKALERLDRLDSRGEA